MRFSRRCLGSSNQVDLPSWGDNHLNFTCITLISNLIFLIIWKFNFSGFCPWSFSNRCFWTKAISIWTSTGDTDHVMIVGAYFHYAGGFEPPKVIDIWKSRLNNFDYLQLLSNLCGLYYCRQWIYRQTLVELIPCMLSTREN